MQPPVALLLYPKGYPEAARFFPFAEFSPEWCAMLWATKHNRAARFIDLPTQASVVEEIEDTRAAMETLLEGPEGEDEPAAKREKTRVEEDDQPLDATADNDESDELAAVLSTDPLNALAEIAGHSDGESWWNALVEQSVHFPGSV